MKHFGELAITGVLLGLLKQAGFVPRKVALISQSVGFCCTNIIKTYVQSN